MNYVQSPFVRSNVPKTNHPTQINYCSKPITNGVNMVATFYLIPLCSVKYKTSSTEYEPALLINPRNSEKCAMCIYDKRNISIFVVWNRHTIALKRYQFQSVAFKLFIYLFVGDISLNAIINIIITHDVSPEYTPEKYESKCFVTL